MQRNYFRGLIICLVPTLVAGYFAVFGEYKKGIDLAGGTILVFEVDREKTEARLKTEGRSISGVAESTDLKKLAENIKRRIDPVDTRGVIVRPVGDGRIEILLPFTEKKDKEQITEDFVQKVKNVVGQSGVLEFRILANATDDEAGIRAAQTRLETATPDELDKLARVGLPPPGPEGEFPVRAASTDDVNVRYVWAEMGKEERESLGLSNAYAVNPPRDNKQRQRLWLFPEVARDRSKPYLYRDGGGVDAGASVSMLIWSRECKNERITTKEREDKKFDYYVLTRLSPADSVKVGGNVTLTASADQDSRTFTPSVSFRFNADGAALFGPMNERNKKQPNLYRSLAIILDGQVVSAPRMEGVIRDNGQISGGFTQAKVDELVQILRSGALNAELKPQPVSENSVGPTLGADTIRKGLWAVGVSFAAVMVFMVIYYRFVGLVACVALLINLLLTVGFMIGVNAAFTLAGLAGIVLMLGMAVDANVLIYERMREEREKGATLAAAVRNGYDRSMATILDTHVTSILTAVVLFVFGNDNLKGFAVSLTVGLVISLFTALFVTRLIIDFAMQKRWFTTFTPLKLFSRPNFRPMTYRVQFFSVTTALTVLGLGLFLARGDKVLNVDFTRGTSYTARLVDPLPLSGSKDKPGLLELLSDENQKARLKVKDAFDPNANQTGPDGQPKPSDGLTYTIQYEDGTATTVKLSNKPAGAGGDAAAQKAALVTRASSLPDVSVETMRLSGVDDALDAGTARSFTVRTTEQEQRLVEVILDRLLRDSSGKPLLAMNPLTGYVLNGTTATLTFEKPISPEAVRGQLAREFESGYLTPEAGPAFDLEPVFSGEDSAERAREAKDGKHQVVKVDVSKNAAFAAVKAQAETAKLAPLAGGVVTASAASLRQMGELEGAIKRAQAAFAATPLPDSVQTFDPALAADTRNKALYAIVMSWMIILAYLWFRFGNWTFGLAAVFCLIHDLCFTLGCIAVCHYLHAIPGVGTILGIQDFKIDLAAVAALLTLVGYSVNDTIVVFDRIREVRGKNPALTPQIINDSVNQTLSRTMLASLTVFLVVGVLYFFGGNGVHLFAFVMVVGVIVGTYSSIFVAAPLLLLFGEGKIEQKVLTPAQAKAAAIAATAEKPTAL